MLFHEVSRIPMSRSTPSSMSLITSGGARNERISERDSDLIFPIAVLASVTKGSISSNSFSISRFLSQKRKPNECHTAYFKIEAMKSIKI